jgi:L-glyceraldehyde 3-phosphate reductase
VNRATPITDLVRTPGLDRSAGPSVRSTAPWCNRLKGATAHRGQTLAQLALAWTLRDPRVTSTLIGASSVAQLEQNVAALERLDFDAEELADIDRYAQEGAVNIWASSSDA